MQQHMVFIMPSSYVKLIIQFGVDNMFIAQYVDYFFLQHFYSLKNVTFIVIVNKTNVPIRVPFNKVIENYATFIRIVEKSNCVN